jgi:hypothetical protein
MVIVGISLFLTTKPNIVKFEVEGTVAVTGKDAEINRVLEVDLETKIPHVFQSLPIRVRSDVSSVDTVELSSASLRIIVPP